MFRRSYTRPRWSYAKKHTRARRSRKKKRLCLVLHRTISEMCIRRRSSPVTYMTGQLSDELWRADLHVREITNSVQQAWNRVTGRSLCVRYVFSLVREQMHAVVIPSLVYHKISELRGRVHTRCTGFNNAARRRDEIYAVPATVKLHKTKIFRVCNSYFSLRIVSSGGSWLMEGRFLNFY